MRMILYLDEEYVIHLAQNEEESFSQTEIDLPDGLCDTFLEGLRFVPDGETWIREDGKEFHGEMLTPAVWSDTLEAAQEEYEKADRIIRMLIHGGEGE